MSLTVALIFNVIAVLALLGGLAYVLAAPRRLEPHRPVEEADLLSMYEADETDERAAA